jgi:hypothetical protein
VVAREGVGKPTPKDVRVEGKDAAWSLSFHYRCMYSRSAARIRRGSRSELGRCARSVANRIVDCLSCGIHLETNGKQSAAR